MSAPNQTYGRAGTRSKSLTYLRSGKVHVLHARTAADARYPHEVLAIVEGHHGAYQVRLTDGAWSCTCQGQWSDGQTCPHAAAVQLVTARESAALPVKAAS